jgi:hypothetical protein
MITKHPRWFLGFQNCLRSERESRVQESESHRRERELIDQAVGRVMLDRRPPILGQGTAKRDNPSARLVLRIHREAKWHRV